MTSAERPPDGGDKREDRRPDAQPAVGFSRRVRVATTGSTNADLVAALATPDGAKLWPHLSVLVADHQAAGRGRAGRAWETPPGTALTASVILRSRVRLERWSWLSLLGGLAIVRAVRARTGLDVALKWPNDVLVLGAGGESVPGWGTDRKVAGVLAQIAAPADAPGAAAAVLGFGVNVHQSLAQLPVPWATSLAAAGVGVEARDPDALLTDIGLELRRLTDRWEAAGGDAERCGLSAAVRGSCVTLGREITVTLPGAGEVTGRADSIDDDGALLVGARGGTVRVTVGDVGHLRAPGR